MAVNDERARTPDRFLVSCDWAYFARAFAHPSTLACVRLRHLVDARHSYICSNSRHTAFPTCRDARSLREPFIGLRILSCFHGSIAAHAVETLEQGRALIWSEMRGLRTSIDQIRAKDTHLADKFAAVNRDLEMLTLTISADGNDDGREGGSERMDPFGHLVLQQRKLLDDRNKLISQIQTLPGFETFLKSPSSTISILLLCVDRSSSSSIADGVRTSSFSSTTLLLLLFLQPTIFMFARSICAIGYSAHERRASIRMNMRKL
jgi:hypothetical protein